MKIRTHDGAFEVVMDETPQGFYLIWLPTGEWLGLGVICEAVSSLEHAKALAAHMVNRYALMVSRGFSLRRDGEEWFFVHANGRRCPFHTLQHDDIRTETISFTQL